MCRMKFSSGFTSLKIRTQEVFQFKYLKQILKLNVKHKYVTNQLCLNAEI